MISLALTPSIAKGFVVLLARRIRSWWIKQPLENKHNFKEMAKDKRVEIWFTGVAGLGLFAGFLWGHSERDPVTGRRRLYLLSDSTMLELVDNEVNMTLEVLNKRDLLLDTTDSDYIRVAHLTEKLLKANENLDVIRNRKWRLVVISNPQINAFVLPNGFIFMHTGITNFTNDDQLTIIIGHELTHCMNRHLN